MIEELSKATAQLRSSGDGLRWTAPASWHITLQFLGNTSPEQFECIVARLKELRLPRIPIRLEELGCFERTGVVFAGVRVSPELLLAHQRVIAATALCGFAGDMRAFRPHVTLARNKGKGLREPGAKLRRHPGFSAFSAEEFLLYESFLGAGGSRYEIRERFSLDASTNSSPMPPMP